MAIDLQKILLIDEFLLSCKAIKQEKWRYLFLFFQFFIFAGEWKYAFSDGLLLVNMVLSGFLAMRHRVEWRKIGVVMFIYILMTLYPIMVYGINEKTFISYVGYAIRILTGCFIVSYYRYDFISKFENLVFVLAYISIPLFLIQLVAPQFYKIFTPLTNIIVDIRYYSEDNQYLIIYVFNGWATKRNSGFMWEPGAYAMMLTWASLCLIYKCRFKWHRRMMVYIITMLTTFSLLGYACLVVLLLLYFAYNPNFGKIGYSIVGGGLLLYLLWQTPLFQEQKEIMTNKVEYYAQHSKGQLKTNNYLQKKKSSQRVGRIAQFYILGDIIREDPFGRGMETFKYDSANGFIDLIVKWGINAMLILTLSFYFFTKRLAQMARLNRHWYIILMSMIVLTMPAISNPVYNRVFFLSLIVFPFFAKRQQIPNTYAR